MDVHEYIGRDDRYCGRVGEAIRALKQRKRAAVEDIDDRIERIRDAYTITLDEWLMLKREGYDLH